MSLADASSSTGAKWLFETVMEVQVEMLVVINKSSQNEFRLVGGFNIVCPKDRAKGQRRGSGE